MMDSSMALIEEKVQLLPSTTWKTSGHSVTATGPRLDAPHAGAKSPRNAPQTIIGVRLVIGAPCVSD